MTKNDKNNDDTNNINNVNYITEYIRDIRLLFSIIPKDINNIIISYCVQTCDSCHHNKVCESCNVCNEKVCAECSICCKYCLKNTCRYNIIASKFCNHNRCNICKNDCCSLCIHSCNNCLYNICPLCTKKNGYCVDCQDLQSKFL